MRVVLGWCTILVCLLRNFAQELDPETMKVADSDNVPSEFFGCFTVLQNDNILRPANRHGCSQSIWRRFLGKKPRIPREVFRGGNGGAFLRFGAGKFDDSLAQVYLR